MSLLPFNLPNLMFRRLSVNGQLPSTPDVTTPTVTSEVSESPAGEPTILPFPQQRDAVQKTVESVAVAPVSNRPPVSSWSQRGLFVVGCCRSGTTILENCLNESPDAFLLGEASLYLHIQKPDFVPWFNQMHTQFRNMCAKDTWLPPAPDGATGGYETMARLATHYRWIGEKIAFGPHGLFGTRLMQEAFLDFHAAHFYDSTYLLITRSPNEVVLSSAKLFNDRDHRTLIGAWLQTQLLQIDLYRNFPRVRWIFFEDLSVEMVQDFAGQLQIELSLPETAISQEDIRSSLRPGEIPDSLRGCAAIVEEMLDVYHELRHLVRQPSRCRGSKNAALNDVGRRMVGLLRSVGERPQQNWLERSGETRAAA